MKNDVQKNSEGKLDKFLELQLFTSFTNSEDLPFETWPCVLVPEVMKSPCGPPPAEGSDPSSHGHSSLSARSAPAGLHHGLFQVLPPLMESLTES